MLKVDKGSLREISESYGGRIYQTTRRGLRNSNFSVLIIRQATGMP